MQSLQSVLTNNDNVKTVFKNNVIDNVSKTKDVDRIATVIAERLNNPGSRPYYCKVAWQLTEQQIFNNLETALKGRNPRNYFTWLCQLSMPS